MKKTMLLFFSAGLFLTAGCDRDPYPLDLERFDAIWYDIDGSGTRTPTDEIDFDIRVNTTDPDADDQFITDWDISYRVNNTYVGVIESDTRMRANTLSFTGTAKIQNLPRPFTGPLQPGDRFEFRFYTVDNHGTFVERYYTFVLQ